MFLATKFKLTKLYCKIYRNLNSKIFRTPLLISKNNKKLSSHILMILKNLDYKKIEKFCRTKFKLYTLFYKTKNTYNTYRRYSNL